jgi:hypothetical protein
MPSSSALIPMSIRTSQCLFSHTFTTYEWLKRDCDAQINIGIWADELGIRCLQIQTTGIEGGQNLRITRKWSSACIARRLRPFLEKFLKKNNVLEKFSRNSRKKIDIQISFFYTFGILTTKMTTKMYTKLASIEINDEILSKVGETRKFFGKNF